MIVMLFKKELTFSKICVEDNFFVIKTVTLLHGLQMPFARFLVTFRSYNNNNK